MSDSLFLLPTNAELEMCRVTDFTWLIINNSTSYGKMLWNWLLRTYPLGNRNWFNLPSVENSSSKSHLSVQIELCPNNMNMAF